MSIGSDTVMTVAPDSHRIPYYLPGKKPFVPYFRYSVKVKYSIKGREMQGGKGYYIFLYKSGTLCGRLLAFAILLWYNKNYHNCDVIENCILRTETQVS